MSRVQSVSFLRADNWPLEQRHEFLKKYKLKPIKRVHTTDNFYRYRIKDPQEFGRFITKRVYSHAHSRKGKEILLVIGFPRNSKRSKKSGRRSARKSAR